MNTKLDVDRERLDALYERTRELVKKTKEKPAIPSNFQIQFHENDDGLEIVFAHNDGRTVRINDFLPPEYTLQSSNGGFGVGVEEKTLGVTPAFAQHAYFVKTLFHEIGHTLMDETEKRLWNELNYELNHIDAVQEREQIQSFAAVEQRLNPEAKAVYKKREQVRDQNKMFGKDLYLPFELFEKQHVLRAYAERMAWARAWPLLRRLQHEGWDVFADKTPSSAIYLFSYEVVYTKAHLTIQEVSIGNIKRRIVGKKERLSFPTPKYVNRTIWEEAKRLGIPV